MLKLWTHTHTHSTPFCHEIWDEWVVYDAKNVVNPIYFCNKTTTYVSSHTFVPLDVPESADERYILVCNWSHTEVGEGGMKRNPSTNCKINKYLHTRFDIYYIGPKMDVKNSLKFVLFLFDFNIHTHANAHTHSHMLQNRCNGNTLNIIISLHCNIHFNAEMMMRNNNNSKKMGLVWRLCGIFKWAQNHVNMLFLKLFVT